MESVTAEWLQDAARGRLVELERTIQAGRRTFIEAAKSRRVFIKVALAFREIRDIRRLLPRAVAAEPPSRRPEDRVRRDAVDFETRGSQYQYHGAAGQESRREAPRRGKGRARAEAAPVAELRLAPSATGRGGLPVGEREDQADPRR